MTLRKLTLVLATAALLSAQADVALQRAIRTETIEGDLKGAIEQYGKLVEGSDRAIAAQALIRMAGCYEKLGTTEARTIYERVVRDYADQKEAVIMARARLARNESPASAKGDRPVWTGPEVDIFGRISPDGRYLTYVDWYQTGNLMIHDMVTGADHSLTKNKSWDDASGEAAFSSISPDGRQVVYQWDSGNGGDLLLANLNGTELGEPRRLVSNDEVSGIRPFEWSPDGKWIAVHVSRVDRTSQLGLVAVKDGALRVLRSVDWRGPTNMCFSPDGRFVIYDLPEGDTTHDRDIFALAVDGSRGSTLVENAGDDRLVGMSRKGQLLFASDRAGSRALWAQPFGDGKTLDSPMILKPDFGFPWIQGLTATGDLYVTKSIRDADLHLAPVDLTTGQLLAEPVGVQSYPSQSRPEWSHDGKLLASVDCEDEAAAQNCAISIRDVETGLVRDVPASLNYVGVTRWSADHTQSLLVSGRDLKGRRGLFLVDAANGDTTLIFESGTTKGKGIAGWSADGRKILFWDRSLLKGCRPGRPSRDGRLAACASGASVLVFPTAGGEPREVLRIGETESLEKMSLSWTLDDDALVIAKRLVSAAPNVEVPRELWLVPLSGGEPRRLDIDISGWSTGLMSFSPDGRHVAFMAGKDSLEVWALTGFLPDKSTAR